MTELWINCTSDPTETSKYEVLTAAIKKKKSLLSALPKQLYPPLIHSIVGLIGISDHRLLLLVLLII